VVLVALVGLNTFSVLQNEGQWSPRLGLDLEGGTQLILQARVAEGSSVSQEQLDQAVDIIRQRVDASGVGEAQISTQGTDNIVVAIAGTPDDATLERLQAAAQLEFRPVLLASSTGTSVMGEPGSTATSDPSASSAPPLDTSTLQATPTAEPTDASDTSWITPALQAEYDAFDCASIAEADTNLAPQDEPLITCESAESSGFGTDVKYLLGPVEVTGNELDDASAGQVVGQNGVATNQWAVNLDFDGEGTDLFGEVTTRLVGYTDVRNQFAIVLDGRVISAPGVNTAITDGNAQITGSYTQDSAQALADQLRYGALPVSFDLQSQESVTPTLGQSQLQAGLIAGLIGLILVVAYSLLQYRALASVTIASLVVASVITYFVLTWLSNEAGYRLSLAGVAGAIIAIGVTADSFIVYFERVRDELRDGRMLTSAVENGWRRALRTLIASDGVSFLAALVLYVLAVGNVQGFAFTLGVTTIVDLLVVVLFTHPMLQLLSRTRFFSGGHPMSGLDPKALGAVYRGRAQFREPVAAGAGRGSRSRGEAERRQTIAERKAAADRTDETTEKGGED
jgi:preprotein translocase subunit SecD